MCRLRGVGGSGRGSALCLANLLCLLPLTIICLLLSGLINSRQYGQFYNVDAGEKVCLQQPNETTPPGQPAGQLQLAPCQTLGLFSGGAQRFRLTAEGQLRSQEELCVGSEFRLAPCRDEQEIWVFTQGSGLVHVDSGLCLTRHTAERARLSTCDNRPQQYWWHQLEGHGPPV